MPENDFLVRLTIVPVPVRLWELKNGEKFCLTSDCYNDVTRRYEIYLKISRTKCILDSHSDKPQFSILSLVSSITKVDGYKIVDEYRLPEVADLDNYD